MAHFLRYIGFLVLALTFWQALGNAFTDGKVDVSGAVDKDGIAVYQQREAYIMAPQLPYLPDAELAGTTGQSQLMNSLRIQRATAIECMFSLQDWIDMLAKRVGLLSLHRAKLYDSTAYSRCHPVCDYYIFTLRRILI